jgi:uroporphyrinogen decarboxylase
MNLPFTPFKPDFELLLKTLRREPVTRPVLFEFLLNLDICREFADCFKDPEPGSVDYFRMIVEAFGNLGYDYAPVYTWKSGLFSFPKGEQETLSSRSQNQGAIITDRKSFESYRWPDAHTANYDIFHDLKPYLPDGIKLLGFSNGGVLENATDLVGFENLCMMYLSDPELTGDIFNSIGTRLVEYYTIVASMESVGACVVNDDWGFKTQTMFPPEMMKAYVFPHIRKIIEVIHRQGKPVILHSCGNLKEIMDVIIDELKPEGKHSFEDGIIPVEEAYKTWHDRIAIMGGIDMDFLSRRDPEEVYRRARSLLELTSYTGGFALGSGNSIPDYVPVENYLAMIRAAVEFRA